MRMGSERFVRTTAAALARASSFHEIGQTAGDTFRRLIHPRDDFVLNAFTDGTHYEVLAGSAPGTDSIRGSIEDHPVLGSSEGLDAEFVIDVRDRRQRPDLVAHMEAGGIRRLVSLPIHDPWGEPRGCLIVLLRTRGNRSVRRTSRLRPALGAAMGAAHLRDSVAQARREGKAALDALRVASNSARTMDAVTSVDEIVGSILRKVTDFDAGSVGAVVGVVVDGIVSRVSAVGTTPRPAVEAMEGTRLDGFPIGRQLIAERRAVFAPLEEVSHATRSKIMDPVGARSLLAAAGRSLGKVRVVLSAYRAEADPPAPWTMTGIETVLDHAAAAVTRLEYRTWLASMIDSVEDAVVLVDGDGRVLYRNDRAVDLFAPVLLGERDPFPFSGYETAEAAREVVEALSQGHPDPVSVALRFAPTGSVHALHVSSAGHGVRIIRFRDVTADVETETHVSHIEEHRDRKGS